MDNMINDCIDVMKKNLALVKPALWEDTIYLTKIFTLLIINSKKKNFLTYFLLI